MTNDWKTREIDDDEIDALYDFGEPDTYVPYEDNDVDNWPFFVAWVSLIMLLLFIISFLLLLR
jgi:hypothetical protein